MTNRRIALYATAWIGVSVGVYFLLPKANTTRPRSVTTVTPSEDLDTTRLAQAVPIAPPNQDSPRPNAETETTKRVEARPMPEPKSQTQPTPSLRPEPKKEPEPPPPMTLKVEPRKAPELPPMPKVEPKKEPDRRPMPEPRKEPQPEVLKGNARHLDRPNGAYTIEALGDRKRVKITGKVKTLTVTGVTNEAQLDASELEAQEIIVLDRIDSRSRVWLCAPNGRVELRGRLDNESQLEINAPGGTVEFRGKVEARSRLTIEAPDGRVTFTEPTMAGKDGSKIDNESKVTITARDVEFRGKVDSRARVTVTAPNGRVVFAESKTPSGDGARIDGDAKVFVTAKEVDFGMPLTGQNTRGFVTLTKDGRLRFKSITGAAHIEYRRADPSDPEPTIEMGSMLKKWMLRKTD
jgi:hypothetical protein